jgi:hypothetical protein
MTATETFLAEVKERAENGSSLRKAVSYKTDTDRIAASYLAQGEGK